MKGKLYNADRYTKCEDENMHDENMHDFRPTVFSQDASCVALCFYSVDAAVMTDGRTNKRIKQDGHNSTALV